MSADKTTTFSLNLDGNVADVSEKNATALEGFRAQVESSSTRIKAMSSDLKRLRGSSDEIKAAKAQLTNQIKAEQAAMSAASFSILKLGGSYESLAAKARKAAAAKDAAKEKAQALSGALARAGGPLASVQSLLGSFSDLAGGAAGKLGLLTFGVGALVGMVATLAIGLGAAAIEFAKWAISGADAARTAALTREAFTGSAKQAEYLGFHIDQLAKKVPQTKDEIQELSLSLMKSKVGGQTLIDSMNAISQASAALGDDVGNKLRGMIERGIMPNGREGRFFVTPLELQGTGIAFQQLAESLAKTSKRGVAEARQALLAGRVPLGEGAKALRDAIEQRFGQLNAKKMLSLDNLKGTLAKHMANLTNGIKIDGLLEQVGKLFSLLDDDTTTGAALKKLVTIVGQDFVDALVKGGPLAKEFFYGVLIAALNTATAVYKFRNAIENTFDIDTSGIDGMRVAFTLGKTAIYGTAGALIFMAGTLAIVAAAAALPLAPFIALGYAAYKTYTTIKELGWSGLGKAIVDGIVEGLSDPSTLINAMKALAQKAKEAFTGSGGIDAHSPSRLFKREAKKITDGTAGGVREGTGDVEEAVEDMARPPKGGIAAAVAGGGGGAGARAPIELHVHLHADGASAEAVKAFDDAGLLAKVTKVVLDACTGAGIPVNVGVPA